MNQDTILTIVLGIATVIASVIGARWTGRSTVKAAKITVDAEAFTRAKEIYEGAIEELTSEVGRQKVAVASLHARVGSLTTSVARYEARTEQLEGTLRQHRIPVPAWTSPSNLAVVRDIRDDPNKPPPLDSEG